MREFRDLISGTDFRGTAVGEGANLTAERVEALCFGFGVFLRYNSEAKHFQRLRVGVGHDSRITAQLLSEAVIRGLAAADCEVYFAGLASTPSMFMMTKFEETMCHGAVMITASHHPYDKNGLKFFTSKAGLEHKEIEVVAGYAESYNAEKYAEKIARKSVKKNDYISLYSDSLKQVVLRELQQNTPLNALRVVCDAGNGAGGFFTHSVISPLGAVTEGSIFLNPDGYFPNHAPNPEDAVAMGFISRAVLESKADMGIIFDTDVDRAAVVDECGKEYNRNRLIALVASIVLRKYPNATIVTDSITSDSLTEFIESKGGKHHRFKRGYKNVINEAIRLNSEGVVAPVAIETSGHCAFMDNYFLDDGAYLATLLLVELARQREKGGRLADLIEGLVDPAESFECRIKFKLERGFAVYGAAVLEGVRSGAGRFGFALDQSYEGVRLKFDGGWCLIRMSVHDPNMPVNIECDRLGLMEDVKGRIREMLAEFDGIVLPF